MRAPQVQGVSVNSGCLASWCRCGYVTGLRAAGVAKAPDEVRPILADVASSPDAATLASSRAGSAAARWTCWPIYICMPKPR